MDKQKILSSKKVFSAKLFDVNELEIEFPNGKRVTHHVVERRPVVYIFPLTRKYELYFAAEYNYNTDDIVMQTPAGFIEEGENALQAAKRELEEETGILARHWEALPTLEYAKSSLNAKAYLYVATVLEIAMAKPEETENIKIVKMPLKEAVKKVLNGEIRKAAVVAGILLLDKLKFEGKLKVTNI